ncbi:CDP-alcohol phosphatidyltransferase family protein [Tautonia plasticadhaerens]|uniref:CDP-alcohol phosphatidyltransferase n=1 Tax=Tautonia plasticadhaerens TaxID=2527974 RepID=A0A518H518_9BACT|nr:CDP-alcohol phosphatidyltransferase family protein [Tautonia plasticadhaerens]QDV35939.1 CDP-alcohol phosphatidyltransferase [Tautonia plasticadhaerens]
MTARHPTLSELRRRELFGPDARIGNWLARRFARPTAVYGTWLAVRLGCSANQLTMAALAASLSSAAAIGLGTRAGFVAGSLLCLLAFWLDRVDGQVARWRGTAGLVGVYLDYLMHHAASMALGFSLGFGLANRTGDPSWAAAGFAVSAGWTFLSIHNDCRYKAFFQPLKRSAGSFRVDGGSGGRPGPPAPWPKRGIGMLTWPCYKSCEPHVSLMTLLGLSALAVVFPPAWEVAWRAYALAMAAMAPVLASARVARAVRRKAVDEEFSDWFRPIERSSTPSSPGASHAGNPRS